ncbi:MAG: PAS domain S-box protein [Helicobacteraceae bacterium]|nr:PAS domain S-box protein [Helicobacteraceae bacterium]
MLIETIFNTVKDGLAVVDLESNFLLVNDSYSKMIGFSQQELYKLSCVGLTAPHMIEESKKILKIVLESGRYEGYVKQCVNKNNSIIDVKMDILLMLDKKTILLSSKNITNELKYKREVKDKEDQLLQQSRLAQMGEMISMIAHQWRQPLSAISSTSIDLQTKIILESSQIEDKKDVAEFATYFDTKLEDINNFVQILTTTIEDFRNFYKPNKDSVTIKLEEVIKKSLNIIQASLISDNIEIIEEHNATESIELYESEMMQVILNLLKNTQDNFKEKNTQNPYIKIVTKNKSIEICDNGGGIPENIIEKIFDPYFSTKHEKNGTGLGLYMSKTIVEEHHHGKLSATNSENGVCFKISL